MMTLLRTYERNINAPTSVIYYENVKGESITVFTNGRYMIFSVFDKDTGREVYHSKYAYSDKLVSRAILRYLDGDRRV